MRRRDREVTDTEKIKAVMSSCKICRIGLSDGGEIYIVPMNFGAVWDKERCTLYFHSAGEGRKIELIRKIARAGFEMDTGYELIEADFACRYSARYCSIIGNGKIEVIDDTKEKLLGLQAVMENCAGGGKWEFDDQAVSRVCVIKLDVTNMSCKSNA